MPPEQNELTDSSEIEEEHERPEQGGIQQTNQREEYWHLVTKNKALFLIDIYIS